MDDAFAGVQAAAVGSGHGPLQGRDHAHQRATDDCSDTGYSDEYMRYIRKTDQCSLSIHHQEDNTTTINIITLIRMVDEGIDLMGLCELLIPALDTS